ncbi:GNAT family N-acetyltransferase [Streptomyces sp. NRRL F-5126]|uniref:GNAT family N-acetyltransferase n=1 Tax=Streptomyces sp. NRRL F-5126 TaxID=1463857 RepID=UPI000AC737C7|nr:GNAT family N-acetyltransferase [Streptomyces sp. NRRL F-5126]
MDHDIAEDIRVRHVREDDWDAIVALESRAYTAAGLSEGRAALRSRVRASPPTCFVLYTGRRLAGYLLALPYPEARYPDLAKAEDVAFDSRNLHLHDIVIAEDLRRRGLAGRLVGRLTRAAAERGYEQISLVAVSGSETFWSAQGFTAHDGVVPPGGYGEKAVYMYRAIGEPSRDEEG